MTKTHSFYLVLCCFHCFLISLNLRSHQLQPGRPATFNVCNNKAKTWTLQSWGTIVAIVLEKLTEIFIPCNIIRSGQRSRLNRSVDRNLRNRRCFHFKTFVQRHVQPTVPHVCFYIPNAAHLKWNFWGPSFCACRDPDDGHQRRQNDKYVHVSM